MSGFEERGIERLVNADSLEAINDSFKKSCDICCNHGIFLNCDRCAINETYQVLVYAKSESPRTRKNYTITD